MGGSFSTRLKADKYVSDQSIPALLLLENYQTDCFVSSDDLEFAQHTWDSIIEGKCQKYLDFVKDKDPRPSSVQWFYDAFFILASEQRLIGGKPIFIEGYTIEEQIRLMSYFIPFALNIWTDHLTDKQIIIELKRVATTYHKRGVPTYQYATTCCCLVRTLRYCFSDDIYEERIKEVWTKIFSVVLSMIVPLSVMVHKLSCENAFMKLIPSGIHHLVIARVTSVVTSSVEWHSVKGRIRQNLVE